MKKNPELILELAYESYQKGDFEESLENYIWFFDNAEKVNPLFDGAKYRSLREWYSLALKFSPAYNALIEKKKISYKLFKTEKSIKTFRDYIRICHALKHNKDAIDLFLYLRETDRDFTKKVYTNIESILIENKEWKLCSFYIENSIEKYENILAIFDELIRISESGFNGEYNHIYLKKFGVDLKNLFSILQVDNRENEILKIQEKVKIDLEKRGF